MNEIVISAHGLGKKYSLGAASASHTDSTFAEALTRGFKSLTHVFQSKASSEREFWALQDVNFEVRRGDVVGIIGSNGAGKSTLLKILSRIVEPTAGKVEIRGRVASLLEVGTGFHPELSGRENIYLNGAILGMSRAEIRRKFDEIVAFAEVETFLDMPVKHYSSGMYVRLAFAVAAHLEPDILVVDEVLAVGDARFQAKCLGKMSDVAKQGRTILFVSHNLPATEHLCNRALLLSSGRVAMTGEVSSCVAEYRRMTSSGSLQKNEASNDEFSVTQVAFSPADLPEQDPLEFELDIYAHRAMCLQDFHFFFTNELGTRAAVLDLRDDQSDGGGRAIAAGDTLALRGVISRLALVEGHYRIGFTMRTDRHFETVQEVAAITVGRRASNRASYATEYLGCASFDYSVSAHVRAADHKASLRA